MLGRLALESGDLPRARALHGEAVGLVDALQTITLSLVSMTSILLAALAFRLPVRPATPAQPTPVTQSST